RQTEPVELVLQGSHDIQPGRANLRHPLQPLRSGAEGAPRVKAPPILHLVPGREVPAGAPFAQWLVPRVGGEEGGRLVRGALVKVLGKRPWIDAPVELLLAKRHNPHCSYHIVYRFRWEVKRCGLRLRGRTPARNPEGPHSIQIGSHRASWPRGCRAAPNRGARCRYAWP